MRKSVYTDQYRTLVTRLVAARKGAKLTQQKLADMLERPQSFVAKYENYERRLDVIEFLVIARALGVDACALIRDIDASL